MEAVSSGNGLRKHKESAREREKEGKLARALISGLLGLPWWSSG